MVRVSRSLDRIDAIFVGPMLVANAGLLLVATLSLRLMLETLIDAMVYLDGRVGGTRSGHKVLTLAYAFCAGGSHVDHADTLPLRLAYAASRRGCCFAGCSSVDGSATIGSPVVCSAVGGSAVFGSRIRGSAGSLGGGPLAGVTGSVRAG